MAIGHFVRGRALRQRGALSVDAMPGQRVLGRGSEGHLAMLDLPGRNYLVEVLGERFLTAAPWNCPPCPPLIPEIDRR